MCAPVLLEGKRLLVEIDGIVEQTEMVCAAEHNHVESTAEDLHGREGRCARVENVINKNWRNVGGNTLAQIESHRSDTTNAVAHLAQILRHVRLARQTVETADTRHVGNVLSKPPCVDGNTCTSRHRNDNAPIVGKAHNKMSHVGSGTEYALAVAVFHAVCKKTDSSIIGKGIDV